MYLFASSRAALERKLGESEESPTYLELSWRPGGSAGFFVDLFGFFELTMVVVREREMCQRFSTVVC